MSKIIPQARCKQCGKIFQPVRVNGKYCSRLCIHNSWIDRHKEQWAEYNRKWLAENPNYHNEYYRSGKGKLVNTKRHNKHPLHRKARGAVSYALHAGKITRPAHCQAHGCSNTRLEAHHWKGYDPENWLNVKWLCHKHHMEAEK